MKLNEIADDVGLDVNGEALLARGEQLVKLEVGRHDAVSNRLSRKNFQRVICFSARVHCTFYSLVTLVRHVLAQLE